MKDLKFNILLNDKYSVKMRSIATSSNKSFKSIQKDLQKTGKLGTNIESLNNKLDFLEKKRKISLDIREIQQAEKDIRSIKRQISDIDRMSGRNKITKGVIQGGGLSSLAGKAGGVLAGAAIGAGAVQLGADIVQTTAKYERFEAVLKNTYGSGLKAKQAMNDLQKFAADTPFQIDALTDSFIKLENSGFNPTMENMTNLGDLAASRGKSFDQLTEAILDAETGEFERLKEFGIKGKKIKGGGYKFTFKGEESKEIARNSDAVKAYILSLGTLKGVQGGMNAISKTTGGQLSNLADNWDQLKAVMGSANSGPVKDAISGFSSLVAGAKDYLKVPLSQELGMEKAGINALVSSITDQNTSNSDRISLLGQLKAEYPDFLGDIDLEKLSNEQLLDTLDKVNASYERRIALQTQSEVRDLNKEKINEIQTERVGLLRQKELIKLASGGDKYALEELKNSLSWGRKQSMKFADATGLLQQELAGANWLADRRLTELDAEFKSEKTLLKGSELKTKQALITQTLSESADNGGDLSDEDKVKLGILREDLGRSGVNIKKFGLTKAGRSGTIDLGGQADKIISEINALFDPKKKKVKLTSGGTGGSSGSSGGSSSQIEKSIDSVAGDSRIAKNINITIPEMMSGDVNIITETLKESESEVKQTFLNMLFAAVNDMNGA